MTSEQFEQFVLSQGKDILRFCRMTTCNDDIGDDLYQDVMLRLSEKKHKLETDHNPKSYALSMCILLWKNKRRKYAARMKLAPTCSFEEMIEDGTQIADNQAEPEKIALSNEQTRRVRQAVASLEEKYRLPIYLYYSGGIKIVDISRILKVPENTVKTRMHTAKQILKEKLGDLGYDR